MYREGPLVTKDDISAVSAAMKTCFYEDAYQFINRFEADFARYHGRKYAIMTPNCTSAIHLLLAGVGIGKGDEVIVPDLTWVATAAPVIQTGAKIIPCDVDANWCLNPYDVKKRITKNTKAIIFVDLYSNMGQIKELQNIADEHHIPLIEDAAEALGSIYENKKAGSFGLASVFSFHRTKTITCGEGGMLLLDDEKLYDKCIMLRNHGRNGKTYSFFPEMVGYKYFPTDIQAVLAHSQFKKINKLLFIKHGHYEFYENELKDSKHILTFNQSPKTSGCWVTSLILSEEFTADQVLKEMKKMGIPMRRFFYPLTAIPAFGFNTNKYSKMNSMSYYLSEHGINLPGAYILKDKDLKLVVKNLKEVLHD
ncbi:MAG TPA: DegT/DnrJ/EryC1/StrS family aminotransferase [Patescibacteria group bacterium]|nr:DegT/DnrJ/EryC1/StrS family aminotransferase [Patescibacteria group bacterium]